MQETKDNKEKQKKKTEKTKKKRKQRKQSKQSKRITDCLLDFFIESHDETVGYPFVPKSTTHHEPICSATGFPNSFLVAFI